MNLKCLNCEDSLPTSSGLRILYRHVDTIAQKAEGGVCGWRDRASTIDRPRLQMKTYSCTCSCSLPKIQIFFSLLSLHGFVAGRGVETRFNLHVNYST